MAQETPKELLNYKIDLCKKINENYITIGTIKQSEKFPESLSVQFNIESMKKAIELAGQYKTIYGNVFVKKVK